MVRQPLTLGTAGHIDHGKTTLVNALTGVDTDRLPEEKARGISIVLGYAPLSLPSGRRLSVVDVPGHERFVRTMVSGATGIDFYLMTVAADDGVMPQTREHAAVLRALGVDAGVVAVTKSDVLDPEIVLEEVAELLPGVPAVPVSAPTGQGLDALRRMLDVVAATVPQRTTSNAPPVLHIDRVFTIRGAGTVVTGTLRSGDIGRGDVLRLLPADETVRVRGVQVHDEAVARAPAGQRVAVNLTGVHRELVQRGDVLVGEGGELEASAVLDVESEIDLHGRRLHLHHGTREVPARARRLDRGRYRLMLERPLMAAIGDRLVVRSIAPPGTLGGAIVVAAHRFGAPVPRRRPAAQEPQAAPRPARTSSPELDEHALAVEQRFRQAGHEPPLNSEFEPDVLGCLRATGRLVRAGTTLHFHREALAAIETRVRALIEQEGSITLGRLRDDLGTSRKFAQALLEHLDATRVTRRRPDDSRVLRRAARTS